MKREHSASDAYFEKHEQFNERHKPATHRSEMVPESVVNNMNGVCEMKGQAMNEAYGAAGNDMGDHRKIKSQMLHYNW